MWFGWEQAVCRLLSSMVADLEGDTAELGVVEVATELPAAELAVEEVGAAEAGLSHEEGPLRPVGKRAPVRELYVVGN